MQKPINKIIIDHASSYFKQAGEKSYQHYGKQKIGANYARPQLKKKIDYCTACPEGRFDTSKRIGRETIFLTG